MQGAASRTQHHWQQPYRLFSAQSSEREGRLQGCRQWHEAVRSRSCSKFYSTVCSWSVVMFVSCCTGLSEGKARVVGSGARLNLAIVLLSCACRPCPALQQHPPVAAAPPVLSLMLLLSPRWTSTPTPLHSSAHCRTSCSQTYKTPPSGEGSC